jgi:GTP cyclohydrolase I
MITNALKTTSNNHSLNDFSATDIGDDHLFTGLETPMKADAFKLSDSEKKARIAILFEEIMDVMGLDLTDDSLKGTPQRVAKMYIDEIFFWFEPCQQTKNSIV